MSQRRTSKFTWAALALILGILAFAIWSLFFPHVDEPRGPVSIARASSFASIPIPAQAANIRIAGYRHWQACERYLRFEAPAALCLQTAAKVLPGTTLQPMDPADLSSSPINRDAFRDLSWFDLSKAAHVVGGGGGPSVPAVWVDQDRGVFYYRLTD